MLITKLVVVFGVPGVGKTTACERYACCHPHVHHASAGRLMGRNRKAAEKRTIEEVMLDQQRLVKAVQALRAGTSDTLMLLDAHSIVVVDEQEVLVPADIVAAIEPDLLVFLRASGEVIASRRSLRRDSETHAAEEIERQQRVALNAVEDYARKLSCPLSVVDADVRVDLDVVISTII